MVKVAEKIVSIASEFIAEVNNHIKVNKAYIFGSQAMGHSDQESDLDIAIFSDDFNNVKFVEATAFLFSIARKYDIVCIEPVGFATSDLESNNPFVNEIISSGIEIPT